MDDCELLSVREVADLFHISHRTVREWIRDGTLPHKRFPGERVLYRISRGDIAAFVKKMNQGETA